MSIKIEHAIFGPLIAQVKRSNRALKLRLQRAEGKVLSDKDRALAIHWYAHCGYDIQTIADHFKVDVETLKAEIRS